MNIAEVTDITSSFSSLQKSLSTDWNMTGFTYTTSCLGQSLKYLQEEKAWGTEEYLLVKSSSIFLYDTVGALVGWSDAVSGVSSASCMTKPVSK